MDSCDQNEASTRQRVRIRYARDESIKFISHHDEFRAWERALRRADLPLLYKQGFNPQPHMQFAAPLGVGFTGANELVDVTFFSPLPPDELMQRIVAHLPPGLHVQDIDEVPLNTAALQSLLIGADYSILIYAEQWELSDAEIQDRITTLLTQRMVPRTRQRKGREYRYNLRPLIFDLNYRGYSTVEEQHLIFLRVQQRPGATGRPDEVVDALGLDNFARTLRRDRLYFSDNEMDAALFANYAEVLQSDIALSAPREVRPPRQKKERSAKAPNKTPGRTIGERAADEFV